jgi:hypothetical protein
VVAKRRAVEEIMVRRGLSTTVEGAHQLLVKVNGQLGEIAASFVEAGAAERAIAFIRPFEEGLNAMPVPDFDAAALAEAEADGDEDTATEAWRINPTLENWRKVKRAVYRYFAKASEKLRAGDARHGVAS